MLNSVVKARQQVPFSHLGIAAVYIALRFLLLIFYFWGRVHMCADSHLCLYRSPVGINPPPQNWPPSFLHRFSHQTWDLLIQLDWLPSKPQRPSCLCPPAPGFQVWATMLNSLNGCSGSNSDPFGPVLMGIWQVLYYELSLPTVHLFMEYTIWIMNCLSAYYP